MSAEFYKEQGQTCTSYQNKEINELMKKLFLPGTTKPVNIIATVPQICGENTV